MLGNLGIFIALSSFMLFSYSRIVGVAKPIDYDEDENQNPYLPFPRLSGKNLCDIHPQLFVCKAYRDEDKDLLISEHPVYMQTDAKTTSKQTSAKMPVGEAIESDFARPSNLPLSLKVNFSRIEDVSQTLSPGLEDEAAIAEEELKIRRLELIHELEQIEATTTRNTSKIIKAEHPPEDEFHESYSLPVPIPIRPILGSSVLEENAPYDSQPSITAKINQVDDYLQNPSSSSSSSYYGGYGTSPRASSIYPYDNAGYGYGYPNYGAISSPYTVYPAPYSNNYKPNRYPYESSYNTNQASPYGYGTAPRYGTQNMIGDLFGFGTNLNFAIPILGVDVNTGIGITAG